MAWSTWMIIWKFVNHGLSHLQAAFWSRVKYEEIFFCSSKASASDILDPTGDPYGLHPPILNLFWKGVELPT